MEIYWHNPGFPHHLDRTHGNGITDDPGDDSVIVSLRRAMGDAHRLANDTMPIVDSTCLPMREQLTRDCHVRDLAWNEWKRGEWHPNDMPYWTGIREMNPPGVERAS